MLYDDQVNDEKGLNGRLDTIYYPNEAITGLK
jgi:hypothetical protein